MMMKLIHRHYDAVAGGTGRGSRDNRCPAAITPSCWCSLHLPTLRVLTYARATRPDVLAVTVRTSTMRKPASWCASGRTWM